MPLPAGSAPQHREGAGARHLTGLDAVRVLGLILVVAIHCDHWPNQAGGVDQVFWADVDLVARISVPLFLVLSGLLLAYNQQHRLPLPTFLRRRLGRSLLPWIVWMPIYTLVGVYLDGEVPKSWAGVAQWWALGGGHLWYLLLIPQFYIVYQVWPTSRRGTTVAAVLALAIQIALCAYRLIAPQTAPLNGFFLAHAYQIFPFWIGYFGVGAAFGAHLAAARRRVPAWPFWILAAAGAVLLLTVNGSRTPNATFVQGTGAFLLPTLPLLVLAVFCAVGLGAGSWVERWPWLERAVAVLSRYSLGIYIVHEALTYIAGPVAYLPAAQHYLPVAFVMFLVQVLITLVLAYAAVRVIVATRFSITVGLPPEPLRWPRRPHWPPRPHWPHPRHPLGSDAVEDPRERT